MGLGILGLRRGCLRLGMGECRFLGLWHVTVTYGVCWCTGIAGLHEAGRLRFIPESFVDH